MDIYVDEVPELQRGSAALIDEGFREAARKKEKGQFPPQLRPLGIDQEDEQNEEEPPETHNA